MIFSAALLAAALTTRAQYLMGTVCEISAPKPASIDAAFTEGARIEAMISTWRDDSELSRLNRRLSLSEASNELLGPCPHPAFGHPLPQGEGQRARKSFSLWEKVAEGRMRANLDDVSPELATLLRTADAWRERTGGAFDPRLGALIALWRTRGEGRMPTAEEIAAAPRTMYEEGAFGKGYAIDRMLNTLGASDAVVNFGGQIGVRGAHRVVVADPQNRARPVLELTIRDASISTSSGSEKTFIAGGRRYSHILDPRTGQALPPRGSASVIAVDALTADILSTALYVMGAQSGLRWAREHGVMAIFIDGQTVTTSARIPDLRLLDHKFNIKD